MRKFVLLFITLSTVLIGYSQSERLVLVEQFTQASCGPCAMQNPAFTELLDNNTDIVTYIKYQVSWPGSDIMNEDNPSDVSTRVGYYNVSGVPAASVDGGATTSPSSITQTTLNNAQAVAAPCNIMMQHSIENDIVNIVMFVEATEDMSGDIVAHVAILEELIEFTSPPGSNGEKEFAHVMKKMLPDASGTSIPNLEAGNYIVLEASYPLNDINWYGDYNEEMMIVGFVQDNYSKQVLQAANSSTEPITPINNLDVAAKSIDNLADDMCINSYAPEVTISNYGSEAITSFTVNCQVNESETITYDWNGNIDFLESTTVNLDAVSFELAEENEVTITITNINGGDDDFANNNTIIEEFGKSYITEYNVILFLMLDNDQDENTWEVVNSSGDVIYSGGPYTNNYITEELSFTVSDCYQFIINDAGGNGMCNGNGTGVYSLRDSDNDYVFGEGCSFEEYDVVNFEIDLGVGIDKNPAISSVEVFPNPIQDVANIKMNMQKATDVNITVYNTLGQVITNEKVTYQATGEVVKSIDVSTFNKGLYFIEVKTQNETFKQKVLIK